MPQCIVFTMPRQIDRKNGVPPRERIHIPSPTERSAQQSVQQQKRAARSGARVVNLRPFDLCYEFFELHGFREQPLFRFGHSNRMLSPLSLLIAGLLQESSAIFKLLPGFLASSSPKNWKYKKPQQNTNFSSFLSLRHL